MGPLARPEMIVVVTLGPPKCLRAPSDTLLKRLQSACMSLETSPMGFQSLPPTTILLSPRCPDPQLRPIAHAIEISNVSNVGRSLI
jgi:hypothetical protein